MIYTDLNYIASILQDVKSGNILITKDGRAKLGECLATGHSLRWCEHCVVRRLWNICAADRHDHEASHSDWVTVLDGSR